MIRVPGIKIRHNFGYPVTNCNSLEAHFESHAMNIVLQMGNNYSEMDHQLNVKFQTAIFVLFAKFVAKIKPKYIYVKLKDLISFTLKIFCTRMHQSCAYF